MNGLARKVKDYEINDTHDNTHWLLQYYYRINTTEEEDLFNVVIS